MLVVCGLSLPLADGVPGVIFHSPKSGATVSGRSFAIELEITGFEVPEKGKCILMLNGAKLMEVRQQHVTISMDGAGGLPEGQNSLKLLFMHADDGSTFEVEGGEALFFKEGSPEETAGPFYDDRFDDSALEEMQSACGVLEEERERHPPKHRNEEGENEEREKNSTQTLALGMPVLSARKRYDGEEDDDMRVVQARGSAGFIQEVADLPMLKVFIPSLVASIPHETRSFHYVIYLGFDLGDPVFDDAESRSEIHRHLQVLSLLSLLVQQYKY